MTTLFQGSVPFSTPPAAVYTELSEQCIGYLWRGLLEVTDSTSVIPTEIRRERADYGNGLDAANERKRHAEAKPSQAKDLTGGGDLREAQVDVPLSVSHSCV